MRQTNAQMLKFKKRVFLMSDMFVFILKEFFMMNQNIMKWSFHVDIWEFCLCGKYLQYIWKLWHAVYVYFNYIVVHGESKQYIFFILNIYQFENCLLSIQTWWCGGNYKQTPSPLPLYSRVNLVILDYKSSYHPPRGAREQARKEWGHEFLYHCI